MGAVDNGQRALGAGVVQQRCEGLPGAQNIGQLAHRQQAGARANQLECSFKVDQAAAIQGQDHQLEAATMGQLLPG
ncbi:hypothetical protein D3C74_490320 [compost metagenome]